MEEQKKSIKEKQEEKAEEAVKAPIYNKTSSPEEQKKDEKSNIDSKSKEKKIEKENEIKDKSKKTGAVVNAKSLPISTKHAIAICNMIRNKNIDMALEKLELAEKMKIPVPMRGEIPHKKGIMSGRYPVNALRHFIKVIKSLKANALVNELELEKYKIACKANVASRPYRRFGKGRFKRTHVEIKLIQNTKKKKVSK